METIPLPGFSEPVASWTHLFGAGMLGGLGVWMLSRVWGTGTGRFIAYVIFVLGGVFLFSMSGTYHLLEPGGVPRMVLRRLDHAAIFVLIAATFTPVLVDGFRGARRVGLLVGVWGAALMGIVLKTIWFSEIPEWLGLALYFGLGWFGLVTGVMAAMKFGIRRLLPMLYGGIAYTVGALFDFVLWPVVVEGVIGPHEVFHFFVLAGVLFHFGFLMKTARDPLRPRPQWLARYLEKHNEPYDAGDPNLDRRRIDRRAAI